MKFRETKVEATPMSMMGLKRILDLVAALCSPDPDMALSLLDEIDLGTFTQTLHDIGEDEEDRWLKLADMDQDSLACSHQHESLFAHALMLSEYCLGHDKSKARVHAIGRKGTDCIKSELIKMDAKNNKG